MIALPVPVEAAAVRRLPGPYQTVQDEPPFPRLQVTL